MSADPELVQMIGLLQNIVNPVPLNSADSELTKMIEILQNIVKPASLKPADRELTKMIELLQNIVTPAVKVPPITGSKPSSAIGSKPSPTVIISVDPVTKSVSGEFKNVNPNPITSVNKLVNEIVEGLTSGENKSVFPATHPKIDPVAKRIIEVDINTHIDDPILNQVINVLQKI